MDGHSRDGYLEHIGKHVIFAGFNHLLPITEGTGKREQLVSGINSSPNPSGGSAKSYRPKYDIKLLRDFSRIRDSLNKCMQTLRSASSKASGNVSWS